MSTKLPMFNNTTEFSSDEPGTEHSPTLIIAIEATILCLIICVGIFGNLLILTAIYRFSSLRTITNVFVANLAVADLLLSILGMPFTMASSITYKWVFGDTMCKIQGVINSVFCEASILTLMFVSLERFIAILHPLKYRSIVTPSTVKILLGVIWSQAIICATSTFWFARFKFLEFEHICTVDWSYLPTYTYVFSIVVLFLPFIVMTIFYAVILRTALRQRNKICDIKVGEIQHDGKKEQKSYAKSLKDIKKENKATIMIAIVVGTFSACWFPHAIGVYCLVTPRCSWNSSFFVVTTWLAMLNSALNSGIYGLLNTSFRRAFKSIIFCDRRYFSDNDIVTIVGEKSRRSATN